MAYILVYSQQHDWILFISNLHTTNDFYWSGEANMLEGLMFDRL